MTNENKILIGKIVAPQGLRGEVRVQTFTANPLDLRVLGVECETRGCGDMKFVRAIPNSDVAIMKISGIEDRNAAETLRGAELFVSRESLPALPAGEYYQADLIGMTVMRDGEMIGVVDGMQNFGAGDILELDNGEMISFIGANVNLKNKTITF